MPQPIIEAFYKVEGQVYLVHMNLEGKVLAMMQVQQPVPESWVTTSKESVLAFVRSQKGSR